MHNFALSLVMYIIIYSYASFSMNMPTNYFTYTLKSRVEAHNFGLF